MAKLSKKDRDLLHEAIERAEKPGACKYANPDGTPCCVVGQYVALADRKAFKDLVEYEDLEGVGGTAEDVADRYELRPPAELLARIQGLWDTTGIWDQDHKLFPEFENSDDARTYMHFLVEAEQ